MILQKLIGLTIFIVCLAGLIVSSMFLYHVHGITRQEIQNRGKILVKAVIKKALDSIRQGDFKDGLAGVIKSLHVDPDVEIAMVVDAQGNILAHTHEKARGQKLFLTLWDQEVFKSPEPLMRFDSDNNRYIIGMAIEGPRSFSAGGHETVLPTGASLISLGAIYIGISQERISAHMRKTMGFVAVSLLGVLGLASIITGILTRKIVRPLNDLDAATKQIAEGNLLAQVEAKGDDEASHLARSFNLMTRRLRETTIGKNQLESIVEQKTRALKEANETLLEANTHLQRLQELEARFVSMASHELRTPLTSISGFVSLMQKYFERLSKEQLTNYLNAIATESARLGRMINEILDLKRIEGGRIEINPVRLDLKKLAQTVIEELKIRPNQPNYKILIDGPDLLAKLDEDKTKQILINLLSNAAKYTPAEKTVYLESYLINSTVVINVRDEGPGIPKPLWEKLFKPFARANDEVARKTVGSGLGLAITKSLVETMGGRIRAENLSAGAQFTVVLPRGDVNA